MARSQGFDSDQPFPGLEALNSPPPPVQEKETFICILCLHSLEDEGTGSLKSC